MRFFHTADWQIGMRAAHVGGGAGRVRDERIAAARRVVDAAVAAEAAFLVLAGDTFENNAVDRALVQQVADTLGRFPRPVFVLPGNHDPLAPGSVWEHAAWAGRPNITILRDPHPVPLADGAGTLWPCPLRTHRGLDDPTTCIDRPRRDGDGIRVGLAHGTLEGLNPDESYFPIPADAPDRRSLDYLALGHWHSFKPVGGRMAYSGTHEPTKFGERDSGNAVLVEIDRPGAEPRLTPVRTGGLSWVQREVNCVAEGDLARALAELERLESPETTLLHLTLRGVVCPGEQHLLQRIREVAAARMPVYYRIDDSGLRPAPADDAWLARLPPGAIRSAAERLRAWSDPACPDPDRPAEATPALAARALMELYSTAVAPAGNGGLA